MTKPARNLQFVLLLVASIVLCWNSLAATLRLSLAGEEYTHILLIVPFSAALIYLKRKELSAGSGQVGLGAALLAVSLVIGWFVMFRGIGWAEDVRLSLSMFGLVTWWIASILVCFGMRTFQTLLFPICFLFWVVPIPSFLLDEIIYSLQRQSAFAARILFLISGVPVTQDGTMLSIPGLDIDIAPQCSSIRSSMMLMITTMVLAHLFLRSWWRKALVILAAIPLAAMKNGLRIFTIVQLGNHGYPEIFDSNFHRKGGILFFGISVLAVAILVWGLRWTENWVPAGSGEP